MGEAASTDGWGTARGCSGARGAAQTQLDAVGTQRGCSGALAAGGGAAVGSIGMQGAHQGLDIQSRHWGVQWDPGSALSGGLGGKVLQEMQCSTR